MALKDTEPVTLAGAITAAGTATINVLALLWHWDGTVVAAVNICIGAWVGAVSLVVRARVTPNVNVALTNDDVTALQGPPPDGA